MVRKVLLALSALANQHRGGCFALVVATGTFASETTGASSPAAKEHAHSASSVPVLVLGIVIGFGLGATLLSMWLRGRR
ncbi:MAG: hypothetical protein NVSMB57_12230 [Actinomycetota bacterium]